MLFKNETTRRGAAVPGFRMQRNCGRRVSTLTTVGRFFRLDLVNDHLLRTVELIRGGRIVFRRRSSSSN